MLKDFPPMKLPKGNWGTLTKNRHILEQKKFHSDKRLAGTLANMSCLNNAQKQAYDTVVESVLGNKGFIFFLNGAARTGKTYVYNTIAATLRKKENIVIMVASSSIASLFLDGGITAHSTFRIPINVVENSKCGFTKQSIHAYLFRKTKLIIWDEVPMQHKYWVETVERALSDAHNNSRPFGGIAVILGGDFCQILPVVSKGDREKIISASLRRSLLWRYVQVLTLVDNMRLDYAAPENKLFAEFLMKARSNPKQIEQLPLVIHNLETIQDLILSFYLRLNESIKRQNGFLTERTIFLPRNDEVSSINDEALHMFHGESITYLVSDKILENEAADYSSTIFGPMHKLDIKKYA